MLDFVMPKALTREKKLKNLGNVKNLSAQTLIAENQLRKSTTRIT